MGVKQQQSGLDDSVSGPVWHWAAFSFFWLLEALPLSVQSSIQCSDHHSISNQAHTELRPCMEDLVSACVFRFHESCDAVCLWTNLRSDFLQSMLDRVKLQNSFHTTAETQRYSYVSDCLLRNMKGTQEGKMLFLLQNKPSFSLLWIISHRNAVPAATWFFSINLCKLCKFVRVWVWDITPERSDSRSFSGHNRVFYKWSSSIPVSQLTERK